VYEWTFALLVEIESRGRSALADALRPENAA